MNPLTCNLALLVSAALGGGGAEERPLPVTLQDDALMLHRPAAQVRDSARRMVALGVDRVRLTASWSAMAPRARAKRMPRFRARESRSYPREPFERLDQAVRIANDVGLETQIDVAFFAPRWAVQKVVRANHPNRHRWNLDRKRFAHFAEAVAKRYSGRHPDPARSGEYLPAVRLWSAWNEPNHPAFLLPQWRRVRGRWIPHSPHFYRGLHARTYRVFKRVDGRNQVLLGNLAALGMQKKGIRKSVPPMQFMRELACVDRRGRHLRRRECRNFKPLRADGLAHHPYSLYDAPDVPSKERDDVTIGDLERLSKLLDSLHQSGRTTTRLPIFITEYGYESNPPDVVRGVSLMDQARYHGLATYLAWRQPDVAMFAQFLLNDIEPPPDAHADAVEASRDWHSGLHFHDGRPKPAAQAFKLPFWAEAQEIPDHNLVLLFGQVRPGEGRKHVELEGRGSDGVWRPINSMETRQLGDGPCGTHTTDFLTDSEGFYRRVAPYYGPASYRARWIKPNGSSERSVPIPIGTPGPPR